MSGPVIRAVLTAFCTLTLASCIDSSDPILSGSQRIFGAKLHLQFYALNKGFASDPEQASFAWNGARYKRVAGGMRDTATLSVHPFESDDYIIQEVPVRLIDDAPTRAVFCGKGDKKDPASCRIKTREALIAFARATAGRTTQDGGLAIRLADRSSRAPLTGTSAEARDGAFCRT